MSENPDEHGPKIASLETWRDQMNEQFRALNSSFTSGLDEIKSMIRANEEIHRKEISSVKLSIDSKTKPPTNIVLQIIGIGLILTSLAGTIVSWRITHHESLNDRSEDRILGVIESLSAEMKSHSFDGHPAGLKEEIHHLEDSLKETRDRLRDHEMLEGHPAAIVRNGRNEQDILELRHWQEGRQSGSVKSNTEQAERIRALERAVYGRENDE